MRARDFLEWPFFTPAHRELAERLDGWAERRFPRRADAPAHAEDRASVDARCRALVGELGAAGWTRYSVPFSPEGPVADFDVRALALIRETLAWQDGLADFAFAMQGLGSGPISLEGSHEVKHRYLPGVAAGKEHRRLCALGTGGRLGRGGHQVSRHPRWR
jgi:acyl-CoA dehydrogenase